MNDIRDYLDEYMINTENRVYEYLKRNYNNLDIFNHYHIHCMNDMYIKRFNEDIVVEYIKVLSFDDDDDDELIYYLEDITPNFFLTPYEIHVEVKIYIEDEEEAEEDEEEAEEDEEEQRDIPTFKIFKVDNCVICLNNKPEIMFYDCLHCCVFSDCDKVKPLMKCPYCRKEIIVKIII